MSILHLITVFVCVVSSLCQDILQGKEHKSKLPIFKIYPPPPKNIKGDILNSEELFLSRLALASEEITGFQNEFVNIQDERVNVSRPPEENGNAFESDIILTKEQREETARDILGKRKRRQAVSNPNLLWPRGIIVYKYDENFPNTKIGMNAKANIAKAMKMWEDPTCLRFVEQTPSVVAQVGHNSVLNLVFGRICAAAIGRQKYSQELEVGGTCIDKVGSIAHELGHAAGLLHPHLRPDRDEHILVFMENVIENAREVFHKYSSNSIRTDEPYDIGSIMHCGPLYFSKDSIKPLYTMTPKGLGLLGHMGQREQLSFMDIKVINDLYNCGSGCPPGVYCKNGGYIGPNCACACPIGLAGRDCTDVVRSNADCGGVLKGPSGKFTTPGFPNKYPTNTTCTWLIQGPAGSSIHLEFTSFDIEKEASCFYDYVEVKLYGPTLAGSRFCNGWPGKLIHNDNTLVVSFRSDEQFPYYGFEANYSIHSVVSILG